MGKDRFSTGPKDWIKAISIAYRSEYNNKHKEQVTLLTITDGKKWYFLAVINLSALLQGNSSNHEGDFYCSNCFSQKLKINLKNMKEYAIITIVAI